MVVVFAYAFPHRKTQDFLLELNKKVFKGNTSIKNQEMSFEIKNGNVSATDTKKKKEKANILHEQVCHGKPAGVAVCGYALK